MGARSITYVAAGDASRLLLEEMIKTAVEKVQAHGPNVTLMTVQSRDNPNNESALISEPSINKAPPEIEDIIAAA